MASVGKTANPAPKRRGAQARLNAGPATTAAREALVASLVQSARARNTTKAHESDLDRFRAWGGKIPCEPFDVAVYLGAHAKSHKPTTLRRWMASISVAHQQLGLASPCRDKLVLDAMRSIQRKHLDRTTRAGVEAVRRVDPIDDEALAAIVRTCDDTLLGLRDKALLLVGFAGALRRSELVGVRVHQVTFDPRGMRIDLGQTKASGAGVGESVTIPMAKKDRTRCPVKALCAWLRVSGIVEGAAFRRVDRHGNVGKSALTDKAVALVVKKRVLLAGLDPEGFAGHSLRAGLITTAMKHGRPRHRVKKHSRHKSDSAFDRYVRDNEDFERNAADVL